MSGPLGRIYGNDETEIESTITETMFRMRCCIPAIVQSYNQYKGTVEVQPAIREKVYKIDGTYENMNLPLLINVPVAFPSTSGCSITFPLKKGDECLVLFSDLSIDNFWISSGVQDPVECRRHDLSDGIAIPCCLSVPKFTASKGARISFVEGDIIFTCSAGSISVSSIITRM